MLVAYYTKPIRQNLPKTPKDYGMDFNDVNFLSSDGVQLSAWEIPCEGSDRLAMISHPLNCNKYGFQPNEKTVATPVHVESLKLVKRIHEAGYNVITVDLRGAGDSGDSKEGISTVGPHEARDIICSMNYVLSHEKWKSMKIALVTQGMSANATFHAMNSNPELFETCTCMFSIQPVQMKYMLSNVARRMRVTEEDIDNAFKEKHNFSLYDMSPMPGIKALKIPVFYSQVRADKMTIPRDLEEIYDATPVEDKFLYWI